MKCKKQQKSAFYSGLESSQNWNFLLSWRQAWRPTNPYPQLTFENNKRSSIIWKNWCHRFFLPQGNYQSLVNGRCLPLGLDSVVDYATNSRAAVTLRQVPWEKEYLSLVVWLVGWLVGWFCDLYNVNFEMSSYYCGVYLFQILRYISIVSLVVYSSDPFFLFFLFSFFFFFLFFFSSFFFLPFLRLLSFLFSFFFPSFLSFLLYLSSIFFLSFFFLSSAFFFLSFFFSF